MLEAPKVTKSPLVPAKAVPFRAVALFVPVPLTVSDDPLPSTIAAVVFVPLVMVLKAGEPPPPPEPPQAAKTPAWHPQVYPLLPFTAICDGEQTFPVGSPAKITIVGAVLCCPKQQTQSNKDKRSCFIVL
jgi:hypothetical protein